MDRSAIATKALVMEQYAFFREAEADFQRELLRVGTEVRIRKGSVVFDRQGACDYVALIGAGTLRVYIANENTGREITLYHVAPGEACPINLLAALLDQPVAASAVVESDVHGVTLPAREFDRWIASHKGLRDFLIAGLAGRYPEIFQQIHEISFGRMDQRLARFLAEGFAASAQTPPVLLATHEQIASDLSTAREVVSRLLREFERMGAVNLGRGRLTLRDRALLESIRG
jgi:CRP/FNR family transcriptional regulator